MTSKGTQPLHFTTLGSAHNPALLLLHGFMGSGEDWHRTAEQLAERYLCILPDLPGHGGSVNGPPAAYTIPATVERLLAMLHGLGVDSIDLGGYSLGGRIALNLALEAPAIVRGLVLESASPGLTDRGERERRQEWDRNLARRLRSGELGEFVTDWYRQPLFESLHRDPALADRLQRRRLENSGEGLALSLEQAGTGSMLPLWSRLGELRIPVLLACGGLDQKYVTICNEMAKLLPRHRLQCFADAGHNIHLERPEEFISELDRWLVRSDLDRS